MRKYITTVLLYFMISLTGCNNVTEPAIDYLNQKIDELSDDEPEFDVGDEGELPDDYESDVNYYEYVNSDVYDHLEDAYKNFEEFRKNGSASNQMKNNGCQLNSSEADFVDEQMELCYKLIKQYVKAYEDKDYNKCYETGKKIYDLYTIFGPDTFYKLKVMRNLPKAFQSPIAEGNSYDDNIILENGNKICLIGPPDDIVGESHGYGDPYSEMFFRSKWFRDIFNIFYDNYGVFSPTEGYENMCFIMNYSLADRTCKCCWDGLISEGNDSNPDKSIDSICWDADLGPCFCQDNEIVDRLSEDQENTLSQIFDLQDAVVYRGGDPYEVDSTFTTLVYGLRENNVKALYN